jgi:uncharacterized membrane protein YqjE
MLFVKEGLPGETFILICLRSVTILTLTKSLTGLQIPSIVALIFFWFLDDTRLTSATALLVV